MQPVAICDPLTVHSQSGWHPGETDRQDGGIAQNRERCGGEPARVIYPHPWHLTLFNPVEMAAMEFLLNA